MPDYELGKIYKITSPHTDKIYIGSTCEKHLSNRLAGHKSQYKCMVKFTAMGCSSGFTKMTSYELIKLGEVEIVLIENYPCKDRYELLRREREIIDENKDKIVNKGKPIRTQVENDEKESKKESKKELSYWRKRFNDMREENIIT